MIYFCLIIKYFLIIFYVLLTLLYISRVFFYVFYLGQLLYALKPYRKYLEQNKETQHNWTGQEKFDIYFCVIL